MRSRLRRRAARTIRGLEVLEDRTVLDASVSIDAAGMLTLDVRMGYYSSVEISHSTDGYLFDTTIPLTIDANAAGLPVDGVGTTDLRVEGITGITVVGHDALWITLISTDVPTTIHAMYDSARVTLGGDYGSLGLQAITAPVVVDASYDENSPGQYVNLKLMDRGSTIATTYTVTADGIAATGGFGGVTYKRLDKVQLYGTEGDARFDVSGVMAGRTLLWANGPTSVFDVDADMGPDERPEMTEEDKKFLENYKGDLDVTPALSLSGGYERSTFNVKRTPTWMSVESRSQGFDTLINITRDGSTAGITHDLLLGSDHNGMWKGDVVIDDSAGTEARDAHYQTSRHDVFDAFYSYYHDVRTSALTRASGGGEIHIVEHQTGSVFYKAPRGLANSLTIDLGDYSPLPSEVSLHTYSVGAFSYDGGHTGAGDPESTLTIAGEAAFRGGRDQESPYISEVNNAYGPGFGSIVYTLQMPYEFTYIEHRRLMYAGLSPAGLNDLAILGAYRLDSRGATDPGVVVTAGVPTADGLQTMRIASQTTPPAFIAVTIANKTSVTIDTHGSRGADSTVVDYGADAPVAGLSALTIITDHEDQVNVASAPPGVPVVVDRTTIPRVTPEEDGDGEGGAESPSTGPTDGQSAEGSISSPATSPETSAPSAEPGTDAASPAAGSPTQVVGGDRTAIFGTAMRTHAGSTTSSRFGNLRAARAVQLLALRARRRERLQALQRARAESRRTPEASQFPQFQQVIKLNRG